MLSLPITVNVNEAKNQLRTVVDWAVENGEEGIIESRREPRVVIQVSSEKLGF